MANEQSAEQRRRDQGEAAEPRETQASERQQPVAGESGTEAEQTASVAESELDAAAASESGAEPAADSGDEAAEGPEAEIARLSAELEAARAQADENWQRYLRAEAEKENLRKRAEKDADSARRQGTERLANELLGVRDSLELGVDAAAQEDADVAKIREGTELTLKMLVQAMEKCEIEQVDPVGERFDPEFHQAMSMQEVEDQESNTVVSVMQKGYRLGDRLLRPALVMVAK